jgi:hypothetical protein
MENRMLKIVLVVFALIGIISPVNAAVGGKKPIPPMEIRKPCVQFSKEFFLENMDGIAGQDAPNVGERPKYVSKLIKKIVNYTVTKVTGL